MKIIIESKDIKLNNVNDAIKHIENLLRTSKNYDYISIELPSNNGILSLSVSCSSRNDDEAKESLSYSQLLNKLKDRLQEMLSWIDLISKKISLEEFKLYMSIDIINHGDTYAFKDEFHAIYGTDINGKFHKVEAEYPWECKNFELDDVLSYVNKLSRKITSRSSWTNYTKSARELLGGDFDRIVDFIEEDSTIDEVYDKLQLFAEPSVQGNMGSLFIYDDSGEDRFESFDIDWEDWNNDMIEMIASSKSKNDFKAKLTKYFNNKIAQNSL